MLVEIQESGRRKVGVDLFFSVQDSASLTPLRPDSSNNSAWVSCYFVPVSVGTLRSIL